MFENIPLDPLREAIQIDPRLLIEIGATLATLGLIWILTKVLTWLITTLIPPSFKSAYSQLVAPHQRGLSLITVLVVADLVLLIVPFPTWVNGIEISLGISIGLFIIWIASQILKEFFDIYVVKASVQSRRRLNSQLLLFSKFAANSVVIVIVLFAFAVAHRINVFGLLASLGIGGVALAFAAKNTLEQILGGIVIYVDRPFMVDDYIAYGSVFGRVESIGLRSTRIRISGRGTILVVPNSSLTSADIENYTDARKIITMIYLTFSRTVPEDEKAFIRQIILASTKDLGGLDTRSTQVTFEELHDQEGKTTSVTQAQINLFVLGSGSYSMELRRQLIDGAKQNIALQLKDYGISFDMSEQTINVDSPITI